MSIPELYKKQNKDILGTDFTTIIHCNSLINFVFTHQCFRQAAVRCCLPVEGKEGKQSEEINNEFVRMYIIKGEQRSHIIESR